MDEHPWKMDFCKKDSLQKTNSRSVVSGPARERVLWDGNRIIPIDQAVSEKSAHIHKKGEYTCRIIPFFFSKVDIKNKIFPLKDYCFIDVKPALLYSMENLSLTTKSLLVSEVNRWYLIGENEFELKYLYRVALPEDDVY